MQDLKIYSLLLFDKYMTDNVVHEQDITKTEKMIQWSYSCVV